MQVSAADQRATEQTLHQRLTDHRARAANSEHKPGEMRDEMRQGVQAAVLLSLSMSDVVASAGGSAGCDDDGGDDSETRLIGAE